VGLENFAEDGIVQQAIRALKRANPDLVVVTDVCLCEYTDHGHCGLVAPDYSGTPTVMPTAMPTAMPTNGTEEPVDRHTRPQPVPGAILNDETLAVLAKVTLSHAQAGADIIAPSGMIDGTVGYLRQALDRAGYHTTPIMSYAVKYASGFYGPFRDAAGGAPKFGDRRTHQMDPANSREALREALLDRDEGADFLMVKPALAYLDVLRSLREAVPTLPLVAYNVSGEYAMVKAAAQNGWLDEQAIALEMLTGMKRAGADLIITYFATQVGRYLQTGEWR
jgi:porphobilinogen synthase